MTAPQFVPAVAFDQERIYIRAQRRVIATLACQEHLAFGDLELERGIED